MKRYSYRDSMGYATSVENWLMNCGDDIPAVREAGAIFRSLVRDRELVTRAELEEISEGRIGFEAVEYTVAGIRNEIKGYREARTHGGKYGGSTYFGIEKGE